MRLALCLSLSLVLLVACRGGSSGGSSTPAESSAPASALDAAEPTSADSEEEEANETATGPEGSEETEGNSLRYVACGCGCCGGLGEPTDTTCVATEEELDAIRAADAEAAHDPGCAVQGCAMGRAYAVCESE